MNIVLTTEYRNIEMNNSIHFTLFAIIARYPSRQLDSYWAISIGIPIYWSKNTTSMKTAMIFLPASASRIHLHVPSNVTHLIRANVAFVTPMKLHTAWNATICSVDLAGIDTWPRKFPMKDLANSWSVWNQSAMLLLATKWSWT